MNFAIGSTSAPVYYFKDEKKMNNQKTLVAFGDSITYGYPFSPGESWVEALRAATGWKVINAGISGDTFYDMLLRIDRDVLTHKPDIVIVMAGTNDVYIGLTQPQIMEGFTALMDRLFSQGAEVWLGMPLPVEDMTERSLALWRSTMRTFAREEGLFVVDFYQDFLDESGNIRNDLLLDGCHPNRAGYSVMGERIIAALKQVLE